MNSNRFRVDTMAYMAGKGYRKLGKQAQVSTAFHPELTDSPERTIQTLRGMKLHGALEWAGNLRETIYVLVEFAYNTPFACEHLKCAPFDDVE
ncbi:hypothetical protein Tco_1561421 [Tanacetum coccineum]